MWLFLSVTGAGLLIVLPSLMYSSRKLMDEVEIDTTSNEKIPSKKG